MKKNIRTILLLTTLIAVCLALAGCGSKEEPQKRVEAKQVSEAFVQAFNDGDAGASVSLLNSKNIVLWEKGYRKIEHKGIGEAQEFIKYELSVGRKWEFIDYKEYKSNKPNTVTMVMKQTGLDYTLAGIDAIGAEMTFTVKDNKITKMYILSKKATQEQFITKTAGGIGLELSPANGKTMITGMIAGSPAAGAGMLIGDEIIAIDGQSCAAMQGMEAQLRTRGAISSKVEITFKSAKTGETQEVELVRVDAEKLAKLNG